MQANQAHQAAANSKSTRAKAARDGLLQAAREHFAEHGFAGASLRAIAADAEVNTAMVHYYFKHKQGLFEAVVKESAQPLLARLQALAESPLNGEQCLQALVRLYIETLSAMPWMPRILVRDVLSSEGARRDFFIQQVAGKAGVLLQTIVAKIAAHGDLRADLNPKLTVLSLISLCAFPFVAAPVVGPALGLQSGEDWEQTMIRHINDLLRKGIMK